MSSRALDFKEGKKHVSSVPKKGETMRVCATFNEKYLCCRVNVLRSIHNCPFECTYCFLQNYLNDGMTKVVSDVGALMNEVRSKTAAETGRFFRIGTWELGDSLALEGETGQAASLIREFSGLSNAVLELKTKSDQVDNILRVEHKGKTVVSWSLNTEYVTGAEELGTAPLKRRLEAMRKAADAGYLIGLHFDPMIIHDDWEKGYASLVKSVFETISPERVAWISMGSLRFNPEMKKKIESNYPESRLTCAEMVLGDDAKVRYVKPLRVEMYRFLYAEINKFISKENLVYLCMERWDVWDKVFGYHPESISHLDYLFAKSLYERYGLGGKPEKEIYFLDRNS